MTASFAVTLAVPAELRAAMRAKSVFDDWLVSDAPASRPVAELPAVDLQMESVDVAELRLSWVGLEAEGPWEAITRATEVVTEILPALLRTRALRVEAAAETA